MSLLKKNVGFHNSAEVPRLRNLAALLRFQLPGLMRETPSNCRAVRGRLLIACAMALLVECGGCRGKDRLDVSPVRGKVVYKGLGVPQATVIFFPLDASDETARKMRPFAYANGEGQFEVKTYVDGDGAPPGKYKVSIIAPSGPPPRSTRDRPADAPIITGPVVSIPPAIIRKYANVDTAGIEVEIQDGENNLDPFVLTM
jgi:hypothetical protein